MDHPHEGNRKVEVSEGLLPRSTGSPFPAALLDYALPPERIAAYPPERRDDARLLLLDRKSGTLTDTMIAHFPEVLSPGDLIVLNDTRVIPAKFSVRRTSGGLVHGLFLAEEELGQWRIMLRGSRRLRIGERLAFISTVGDAAGLLLISNLGEGEWRTAIEPREPAEVVLGRIGRTPLPPYIARSEADVDGLDQERYQTVFARKPGAIAAPTAGLHMTQDMLDHLRNRGVNIAFVTLHVGLGTFKPITATCLSEHVMHSEAYEVPAETIAAVASCKSHGGRVVAVGTTTVRVLESVARDHAGFEGIRNPGESLRGSTDLFIYPPYQFLSIDAMLTNFHLPRSTLLAMVMAFGGMEQIRITYAHAIKQKYRFYSYGDAMLVI